MTHSTRRMERMRSDTGFFVASAFATPAPFAESGSVRIYNAEV